MYFESGQVLDKRMANILNESFSHLMLMCATYTPIVTIDACDCGQPNCKVTIFNLLILN